MLRYEDADLPDELDEDEVSFEKLKGTDPTVLQELK